MNTTASFITYKQAGVFSKTVTDYISGDAALRSFYKHPVSLEGIKAAIQQRQSFNTNRDLLVTELKKQYTAVATSEKVSANIEKLLLPNTFTITTAHQPNIFTGHLYFVYKILHAVKLAETLSEQITDSNFVPVYYMGSEDADLEELGHVYVNGQKYQWHTTQTGAVGRMKVDHALVQLITAIGGQVLVEPFGKEIISLLQDCYTEGSTIEQATFKLVNELFKEYGLVVLLPDNAALKKAFVPIIEKELNEAFSHKAVEQTVSAFPKEYKVQAGGREINLFYLAENARERIIAENGQFGINNTDLVLDAAAMKEQLLQHPECFSPNVILRPVFQELMLPNIAFIGGGGELAYWLELQQVFEAAEVPYPVLVLRNSFMVVEEKYKVMTEKLQFGLTDLFQSETALLNTLVQRETHLQLQLSAEMQSMKALYEKMQQVSGAVDASLVQHTAALQTKALKKLEDLQKKMLRAEKRKYEAQQRQINKLKSVLFPGNGLQERTENLIPFYSKWGAGFINALYQHSKALEQEFCILEIQ